MASERRTTRFDGDVLRELEEVARDEGVTESEVIREAVRIHVRKKTRRKRKKETAYDAFKRLGLIGCAKGMPPDLSTNKKYMEGFGRE